MKRKHVHFEDNEKHLLDHALQHNFTDYVKRLIEYDIKNNVFERECTENRTIQEVYNEWMEKNVWKNG
ncbi:hypothetical protein [Halalkalibacter krulwichiae]|uniref:Uncharacterized protein n=1 Tax=Halalkalibacter krulwichiae TaxID=199441 RepID=A0A1X9MBD5_9BACI|nr:hypothetical protein [Halalkalibacter krulwichiae]ARK30755.1 hypothetical protein BkAM31D_13440 [Halalkalibacter krulwichiae]